MKLISRKEFDRRVTSGELDNLQAVMVKEGFCLIASKADSPGEDVFMLRRTDKNPTSGTTSWGQAPMPELAAAPA